MICYHTYIPSRNDNYISYYNISKSKGPSSLEMRHFNVLNSGNTINENYIALLWQGHLLTNMLLGKIIGRIIYKSF